MQFKSIRAFIGTPNFDLCKSFYRELGFEEVPLGRMSYFRINADLGFYLQDAYVKDWVDNTMLFLEVTEVKIALKELKAKSLEQRYPGVRLSEIHNQDWGSEFFLHDPAGVLWHIGSFKPLAS